MRDVEAPALLADAALTALESAQHVDARNAD
jgi:hypothetical protein